MGDVEDGLAAVPVQRLELDPERDPQARIEVGQRLVQHQQPGAARDRPPDRDPLLLAAGEGARVAIQQVLDPEQRRHLAHPALDLGCGRPGGAQREGDVVEAGEVREQGDVLEQQADVAPPRLQRGDVLAVDPDPAGVRLMQPRDGLEQGRLAGIARPDDAEELAVREIEADAAQRLDRREALAQPLDRERAHAAFSRTLRGAIRPLATSIRCARDQSATRWTVSPTAARCGGATTRRRCASRSTWSTCSAPRFSTKRTTAATEPAAGSRRASIACGRIASASAPSAKATPGRRTALPSAQVTRRSSASRDARAGQDVDRRIADELGDEAVDRAVVDRVRRAELLQPALVHHRDPVRHAHGLELVVGDVEHGLVERGLDLLELGAQLLAQMRVEVRHRLVQQQKARLGDQRAAERDALHLAHVEARGRAIEQTAELEPLDDPGEPALAAPAAAPSAP